MIFMKRLYFVLFLVFVCGPVVSVAQNEKSNKLEWYTDLMKANEQSKATGRPIFGFFTGSDWCGWCHKLENEVFSKTAFIKWAQKKVILLELDFPRMKKLPPELAQQNNSLQQAFKVSGYPTVWIFLWLRTRPIINSASHRLAALVTHRVRCPVRRK